MNNDIYISECIDDECLFNNEDITIMIIEIIYWVSLINPWRAVRLGKMLAILNYIIVVNPLRAKFFRGNIKIHLHFVSFLHIDTTQVVVEILPQLRQEPTYST